MTIFDASPDVITTLNSNSTIVINELREIIWDIELVFLCCSTPPYTNEKEIL